MSTRTRREFIQDAALGVATAAVLNRSRSQAAGASERVRIGVIGCGNQGGNHIKIALRTEGRGNCLCRRHRRRAPGDGRGTSRGSKGVADFRRILDDPSVDAVTIATPDHWHVPVALLALGGRQARVRRESRARHNVREGQLLRERPRRSPAKSSLTARKPAPARRCSRP